MSHEDQLSARVVQPITADEADLLLADEDLRAHCEQWHVDLAGLVANLRLPAEERLRLADHESTHRTFFRCLDELGRRRVRFVLIGGLAGRVYGSTLPTDDFDVCHARDYDNFDRLAALLRDIDAEFRRLPVAAPPLLDAAVFATETDFVFCTRWGKFDLIGEFTGVGRFDEADRGAASVGLGRYPVRVLSLGKLIDAKQSTGRPKDLLVHEELRAVRLARGLLDRATTKAG
jgi:hypothetical protein